MTTTFSNDRALAGGPSPDADEAPRVGRLVEVINDEIRVFHELLDTLQQERLRLVRALSEAYEMDAARADLAKLIEIIDSRHAEELTRMRQVLLDLNGKIRRTNENNAFLIRQSLRYTARCIDLLTGDPGDRGVYGKFGKNMKRAGGNSVLNRTV
jgi:flagellar biosynthesis/type III secretory pathway chaperone